MYEILINPPKEVPITKEEFHNFSYYSLASFICNYRMFLEETEEGIKIWGKEGYVYNLLQYERFKGLKCYIYSAAELEVITVPLDNPLITVLRKKFSHLFLK